MANNTYDSGFDVETLVPPSLSKDGRAHEHVHGAASISVSPQRVQTSHGHDSRCLV